MYPVISVIIPVYNVREYIIECLESVRMQTYQSLEAIIINDGSTDNGEELVAKYIEQYSLDNFYLYSKSNGGISSARNYGLKQAKGEWVFFLDGDDWIEPECLAALVDTLNKYPTSDLVMGGYSAYDCVSGRKEVWSKCAKEYDEMPEGLQNLDSFSFCWGRLYRKSIIDEHQIVFDERIEYAEDNAWQFDYNCWIRSYARNKAVLYNYRINRNGSLTKKLVTPQMKRYIWEHMQHFIQAVDEHNLRKAIKTNIALNRVMWNVLSTAVVNDILDKKYGVAKKKRSSDTAQMLMKAYIPRTRKDIIFIFVWKTSFFLLCLFVLVYYKNFSRIRKSKLLQRLSKSINS